MAGLMVQRTQSNFSKGFNALPAPLAMALMFVIAVSAAGQSTEQRAAVKRLTQQGAEFQFADGQAVSVSFLGSSATEQELSALSDIHSLRSVDFGQQRYTDAALEYLVPLKHLERINLSLLPVTNRGLQKLVNHAKLKSLDLTGTRVTNLLPLTRLKKLANLELNHCAIEDRQLRFLGKMESLKHLDLSSTEVTDRGVRYLSTLPNLESLALADDFITDEGGEHLLRLQNLERLQLSYTLGNSGEPQKCHLSGAMLRRLEEQFPKIDLFGVPGKTVMVEVRLPKDVFKKLTIEELSNLPDKSVVVRLDFSNQLVDDEILNVISEFPDVKSLFLRSTWVTDEACHRIGQMSKLEFLDLDNTRVTDSGLSQLASCKKLRRLSLRNTPITGIAFDDLANLTQLKSLDVSRRGERKWAGRMAIASGLNDAGLEAISKMKSLETLSLVNFHEPTDVTLDGVRKLTRLKGLKVLRIRGLPVDDEVMSELRAELTNVNFGR